MYSKGVYVYGKAMRQFKAEDRQKTEDVTSECMRWKRKKSKETELQEM